MENTTEETMTVTTTTGIHGNVTSVTSVEETVQTLTIIVWILGGFVLLLLFALLARILLARNKTAGTEVIRSQQRRNLLRIQLDSHWLGVDSGSMCSTSRDTIGLVPGPSRPISSISGARVGNQAQHVIHSSHRTHHGTRTHATSTNQSQDRNQSQPRASSATSSQDSQTRNPSGSRATLSGGIVISPPSYEEVVATSGRLPVVVVSRAVPKPQGMSLFSL